MRRLFVSIALMSASVSPCLAQETLKIGFLSTFSGGGAIIGQQQRSGFDLALAELNGRIGGMNTEIVYRDDQTRPDVALTEVEKLVKQDRINVLVGVLWSNVLLAILPKVAESKVFLVGTNTGPSPIAGPLCNEYFFSMSGNNDQVAEAMGRLLNDRNVGNIYLMAPNYQTGKELIAGVKREYKGKVVGEALTKLDQTDYQAEIALIRSSAPGAVFVFYPGRMGISFMKQWSVSGLANSTTLYSIGTVDWLTLPAVGRDAVKTFHTVQWGPDLENDANKKFVAAYKAKYGTMPEHYAAHAYDAVRLLDSAVRAVNGKIDDHGALRAALRKANFESVRGKFKFNTNHFPIQDVFAREVVLGTDGQPTIVTRGTVFVSRKDSFYEQCPMKW